MQPKTFSAPAGEPLRASAIQNNYEGAFVVAVSPALARRQLHVSLGLMAIMAGAFIALAMVHGLPAVDRHAQKPDQIVKLVVQQPVFVRSMEATREPTPDEQGQNLPPRS